MLLRLRVKSSSRYNIIPIGIIHAKMTLHGHFFPERNYNCGAMTKVNKSKEIGQILRQRRKEAGLTLNNAAGMARVGVRFLSKIERGKPTLQIGLAMDASLRCKRATSTESILRFVSADLA